MKRFLVYMLKCFVAAVISVALLSLISMVYYNPPIAVEQPNGVTNFKYTPDTSWSFMWEGYGHGKTDSIGYNNAYYDNLTDPDIVFVGSSHMEALQVPEDKNCVYVLNEKFDKDDSKDNDYKCFNLGMSGHFFEITASNYRYIAQEYKDAKYIVLEAFNVEYSPEMLDNMLAEKYREPIEKKGFIAETVQKVPFFRLMYKKLNETMSVSVAPETAPGDEKEPDINVYIEKMGAVLDKIANISEENGVQPIILLHERFWRDKEGNIVLEMDEKHKNAFKKCCAERGIEVIDVSAEMIEHYEKTDEFSYGFANSTPGEGHLNTTGHAIIADVVYKHINEMEERK